MDMDDRAKSSRTHRVASMEFSDQRSDVSLDDHSVPAISHNSIRARTVAAVQEETRVGSALPDFRDASCPSGESSPLSENGLRTATDSGISGQSLRATQAPELEAFGDDYSLEQRLEAMLDRKIDMLHDTLIDRTPLNGRFVSAQTDDLVKEAMEMFRAQLKDSAVQNLDDSRVDARGDIDFEIVRNVVEQSQEETRQHLQSQIGQLMAAVDEINRRSATESATDLARHIQEVKTNIMMTNAHLSERLSAIEAASPYQGARQEREALVFDLLNALTPQILAMRTEPLDYDGLTLQLSQAVKPHIHQLIDLASDKQETAELIANRLMPILQSLISRPTAAPVNTDQLLGQVGATVSRIVSHLDAHVIKEEVADLVVERLDARLAVRDKTSSVDNVRSQAEVINAIVPNFERINRLHDSVNALLVGQGEVASVSKVSMEEQQQLARSLAELSLQIQQMSEIVQEMRSAASSQQEHSQSGLKHIEAVEAKLAAFETSNIKMTDDGSETLSVCKKLLEELSPLKDSLASNAELLNSNQAEILSQLSAVQDSSQELRKLTTSNADMQVQLTKARAAHGQIRVEKDNLNEKLRAAENETDSLKTKVSELQALSVAKTAEFATLQSRMSDQERAMHSALERLKFSDVNAQQQNERIAELERLNRELAMEKQQLKSKASAFTTNT